VPAVPADLPAFPVDLVVLDVAGTTVDEGGAVYRALADAVLAGGGRLDDAELVRWMGADKRQAIRALTRAATGADPDPAAVERTYADFRDRLLAAYRAAPPRPFPGVPEAFATLRAAGVRLALTTGFSTDVTAPLLEALRWDVPGTVDALVCTDDVPAGRPAPYLVFRAMERTSSRDVRRVAVVGDTPRDLEAGTNAGAGFVVGVATGGVGLAELGRHRHTHLLASVADLPALLASADPERP
jgi:phosphonatase-like hydrolase